MTKAVNLVLTTLVLALLCAPIAYSQTTEITYTGNLRDSGLPANADYDMEFRIFSSLTGGSPIITHFVFPIPVVDGVFTTKFNVGQAAFPGQDRYLEIGVRRSGIGGLITLGPRQRITSAPYAIQSLQANVATTALLASNSQALGGVNASQYVISTDPRMTDARNPIAGNGSYIQNTNAAQASSNFNISGNGTAGTLNATTAFRFGGNHLLSAAGLDNVFGGSNSGLLNLGNNNAFYGAKAGQENKHGNFNAFFGAYAGQNNVDGSNNSFFGYFAGNGTTTGNDNSFFGNRAGQVNTSGAFNSFFGTFSGLLNTTGSDNSFFGNETGWSNNVGNRNSFFGSKAGRQNTGGEDNAFLGSFAGQNNLTGSNNAFVGSKAGQGNTSGMNNSFFGAGTGLNNNASNNTFAGADAGKFNTIGAHNTFVGRNAGLTTTEGELNTFIGTNAGSSNILGRLNTIVGAEANVLGSNLSYATAIGAEAIVNTSNTVVIGRPADAVRIPGNVNVMGTLNAANLSVTNITGVVGTANGGTGLSAAGTAGRFLRSDGTNWQSLPFLVGDIPSGSAFYVQNTTIQQGSTNFNISGNGTAGGTLSANVVNSATQFNIGGARAFSASGGSGNLFAGLTAGNANTTGNSNTFVGNAAGSLNSTGSGNSFFGASSGLNTSSGGNNTLVGINAGLGNTIGGGNTFFGVSAGQTNTIGNNNTVIGANANVGGNNLTYATAIGADAVVSTNNTVVLGRSIDTVRTPGNLQVDGNLIANNLSVNAANLTGTVAVANGGTGMGSSGASGNYLRSNGSIWQSSAIAAADIPAGSGNYIQNGIGIQASSNFNISGNGIVGGTFTANGAISSSEYQIGGTRVLANTGTANIFVGAGTATTGNNNTFVGFGSGSSNTSGVSNTLLGSGANVGAGNLTFATAIGAGATVNNNNSVVLGRAADTVRIPGNLSVTGTFSVPAGDLTGTVAAANGGTGLSSPGTTGNFLRSTGSGWQSQGLAASDIPGGSTNYIQNGSTPQAGAQFNIAGNGTIGGNLTVTGVINGSFAASNITGTVGVGNGGTGLTASTGTNFLRGNGSGGWTSGALLPGDIPSLGGTYIQNQTSQQSSSNFNVSGSGTVGTTMTVGTTLTADIVNAVTQYNINGTRVFATTGTSNIFAGAGAGNTGFSNAFFGANAGDSNSTGSSNTIIGANADVGGGALTNATAIGANAEVTQSNSVVIGGITGVNSGVDTRVGIGTTAPKTKLDVTGGDILVGTPGQGMVLKSPDGSACARISLSNAGALVTTAITCP